MKIDDGEKVIVVTDTMYRNEQIYVDFAAKTTADVISTIFEKIKYPEDDFSKIELVSPDKIRQTVKNQSIVYIIKATEESVQRQKVAAEHRHYSKISFEE